MSAVFSHDVPFALRDFPYAPPPYGGLAFRAPSDMPAQSAFDRFADRVAAAVGREYLPVYRMADGEFIFMVGERRGGAPTALQRLSGLRNALLGRTRTCWGEEYTRSERRRALEVYRAGIAKVASEGVIAAYFAVRADGWGAEYWPPVAAWFDDAGIALDADNYVPFYSVYALLNGPRRRELFEGRNVLVVTHLEPQRTRRTREGLEREGAASVQFLPVSRDKSMLDTIDLSALSGPVDLVLVAAGIGSVNVLVQCQPLGVPAIDCGMVLDCLTDDDRRWERPFLIGSDRADAATIQRRRRF